MTHAGPSLEEIKRASQARVHDVLAALGIAYRPRGNYISMCNPVEKDRHPSFTIWVKGPAAGAFKDHRGLAQGDIIDLVAYVKGWSAGPKRGRREALRFLADLTGLARMSDEQRRADLARSRARAQREDKAREEELADKQRRAFKIWLLGDRELGGTYVDHYLRRRGIELEADAGDRLQKQRVCRACCATSPIIRTWKAAAPGRAWSPAASTAPADPAQSIGHGLIR
jgi:hypothetical protein